MPKDSNLGECLIFNAYDNSGHGHFCFTVLRFLRQVLFATSLSALRFFGQSKSLTHIGRAQRNDVVEIRSCGRAFLTFSDKEFQKKERFFFPFLSSA